MNPHHQATVYREDHELRYGMTLLEASAGTGKTYSVTFLFLRLLLEANLSPSEIVVVTFTRAAASELRDRIHARIADAEATIQALQSGDADLSDPEVAKVAALVERATVDDPLEALRAARSLLDTAAISTIHRFAGRLSEEFAMVTGTPSQSDIVDSLRDIVIDETRSLLQQIGEEFQEERALIVDQGDDLEDELVKLAQALVDQSDLDLLPDFILEELAIAELLSSPLQDLASTDELQDRDILEEALETSKAWRTWGKAQLLRWLDDIRKLKLIDGRQISAKTLGNRFDALSETFGTLEQESDRHQQLSTLLAGLNSIDRGNRGSSSSSLKNRLATPIMRRLTSPFYQEKHKEKPTEYSDTPSPQQLPSILQKLDRLAALALSHSRDIVTQIWKQRVARVIAQRVHARTAEKGIRSHAHIISDVVQTLQGPQKQTLKAAVAKRYRAALIDEFQDTDLDQWQIFQELFGNRDAYTYLIGDPKQAIYGFRGANVAVYEHVREGGETDRVMTLDTNYRSDEAYNHAINRLFDPKDRPEGASYPHTAHRFADSYQPVRSPDRDPAQRLRLSRNVSEAIDKELFTHVTGDNPNASLVLRHVENTTNAQQEADWAATMIAHDIAHLLQDTEGSQIHDGKNWRPIRPEDCAVIVRSRKNAILVLDALRNSGINAVARETQSVVLSPAADGALLWLTAIANPTNIGAIRAFLSSHIVGLYLEEIDEIDEDEMTAWTYFFDDLRRQWWRRGLHASLRATLHRPLRAHATDDAEHAPSDIMSTLLSHANGGRIAADLMHLSEVMSIAQRAEGLSPQGLSGWLIRTRHEEELSSDDAFKRRVESDANAVEIVTAHSSKGLEYPLVWIHGMATGEAHPNFLTHPEKPTTRFHITREQFSDIQSLVASEVYADAESENALRTDPKYVRLIEQHRRSILRQLPSLSHPVLQLESEGTQESFSLADAVRATEDNTLNEDLRLLYVALTRARMRTVFHTGVLKNNAGSILLNSSFETEGESQVEPLGNGSLTRTSPWRHDSLRTEHWRKESGDIPLPHYTPKDTEDLLAHLVIREAPEIRSTRDHMQSYSSLLSLLPDHYGQPLHQESSSETQIEAELLADVPSRVAPRIVRAEEGDDTAIALPPEESELPLANFSSGKQAGTALHAVFEEADFTTAQRAPIHPEDRESLRLLVNRALMDNGLDPHTDGPPLLDGVIATLRTPLGGELEKVRLADISTGDRIDEMKFFMRMGEDSQATHASRIFDVLQQRQGDAAIHPRWFTDLKSSKNLDLNGMLTGFIDLVFRHEVDGQTRYFIADYKSNRIAPSGQSIVASVFTKDAVLHEMALHHYYLQYHIYLVALHRWLRARIADYSYDRHIGGAYYFFVRGMSGEDTPIHDGYARGVFFDRPSERIITALDEAFRSAEEEPAQAKEIQPS